MENQVENDIGSEMRFQRIISRKMENQMAKNMENEIDTRVYRDEVGFGDSASGLESVAQGFGLKV